MPAAADRWLQWAGDSLHLLGVELPTMTGSMRSPRATSAAGGEAPGVLKLLYLPLFVWLLLEGVDRSRAVREVNNE